MVSFFLEKAPMLHLTLGAHGAYYQHRDGTRIQVPAYGHRREMHLRLR
jgi:hypothetical protein